MRIVYIHGAKASSRSFAYIQKNIKAKDALFIEYDHEQSAFKNLAEMKDIISDIKKPICYITHSLGGVYATYLQDAIDNSAMVISLATPFAGSEIAVWSRMFLPQYQLFTDIVPSSQFIRESRNTPIRVPWTQVVTTDGEVPWLRGANDGIVTRDSMLSRSDEMEIIEVDRNHYEIVQSQRVVEIIKEKIAKKG